MTPARFVGLVFSALLGVLAGVVPTAARGAPPGWLTACAGLPTPAAAVGAPAVILHDERVVSIDAKGQSTAVHRFAVRILARGGEKFATGSASFLSGRDSVKTQGPWLLRAGKEIKPSTSRGWLDLLADDASAYNEYRAKTISYADLAYAGDVFGYETRIQSPNLFTTEMFSWDHELPTIRDFAQFSVPPGWSIMARMDGANPLTDTRSADGLTWAWSLDNQPYRPEEPYAPDLNWVSARVLIRFEPPAGANGVGPVHLASWRDVAAWEQKLVAGQCDRDQAIAADVKRLTAGLDDPLARMRAITQYVQKLRYVSVNRNIGIGFGYRPRKASEVHEKGWGDCKDKANLTCAMLAEAGFTAYSASAHLGLGRLVVPDFPTPQQFNHAIVAIAVDDTVDLPAVVTSPRFGRLLFFDATDPNTMLGDLPVPLQGTRVHILAEGSDELTELPILSCEKNRSVTRAVLMTLYRDGSVSGSGSFVATGQTGAQLRATMRNMSLKEQQDFVTDLLVGALRGALIQRVSFKDDPTSGECRLEFSFIAPKFLQFIPGNLAIAKLDLFNRIGLPAFPEKERHRPLQFQGSQVCDRVELTLDEGLSVEELPAQTAFSADCGAYENTVDVLDRTLRFQRVLRVNPGTLPVDDYGRVRQFMQDTIKADRVSAVLRVGGS